MPLNASYPEASTGMQEDLSSDTFDIPLRRSSRTIKPQNRYGFLFTSLLASLNSTPIPNSYK